MEPKKTLEDLTTQELKAVMWDWLADIEQKRAVYDRMLQILKARQTQEVRTSESDSPQTETQNDETVSDDAEAKTGTS